MGEARGINIAIIHLGFFYSGGGERTVLNEAIGLQNRGYSVDIYCPTLSSNCYPELMKKVNINEFFRWLPQGLKLRDAIGMLLASVQAPSIINRFKKYDLILSHSQPSSWLAFNAKRRYGIPYVCYLHQPNRFLYPRRIDQLVGYDTDLNYKLLNNLHSFVVLIERLDRLSIEYADLVLTNSKWIKKSIDKIYDVDSIVCYPGVDRKFYKREKGKGIIDDPYILSTNRHYPQKRLDYLILSLPRIIKGHPDIRCVITGSYTNYTKYLLSLIKRLNVDDNVVLTDHLSEKDLLEVYQNAYLYTYTSPEEDFGLGPLEAGACGVPSVVWDHAGPRETVIDVRTGFRVKPYDVVELAEKQIFLLDDPSLRMKMGDCASKFVKESFTWENHLSILESSLDSASNFRRSS